MLATYMRRMRNENLEIRIAGSYCEICGGAFRSLVHFGLLVSSVFIALGQKCNFGWMITRILKPILAPRYFRLKYFLETNVAISLLQRLSKLCYLGEQQTFFLRLSNPSITVVLSCELCQQQTSRYLGNGWNVYVVFWTHIDLVANCSQPVKSFCSYHYPA